MKSIIVLIFVCASVLQGQDERLAIIPQPAEIQKLSGEYVPGERATISYDAPGARSVAEMLARNLRLPAGSVRSEEGANGGLHLRLRGEKNARWGKEGYTLEVTAGGIVISASEPAGLFYGMQTLLQLLPGEMEGTMGNGVAWRVPAVRIVDYPRFAWRGLMLDVSRHFFSKDDVKSYIEQMVNYKFNTFHWHLTDDNGWRIEIKAFPKLTRVGAWRVQRYGHFNERPEPLPGEPATYGGFYTQEDIREVVQFARDRFVTIVPEVDLPGHSMAAIASYPELSTRKDTSTKVNPGTAFAQWFDNGTFKMRVENAVNPSDEKVYEFFDTVFGEIAPLFPGQYVHVGGDECYYGYWAEDPGCQALMKRLNIRHVGDLQGYFLGRLEKILKAKGKKLIGWDEILEGGIAPEATVMSWRGMKGGIEAAKLGHDVVMTPSTHVYLNCTQGEQTVDPFVYTTLRARDVYAFEPVPEGVDPRYILGGQGNLWTEEIPTLRHLEYMTYPRGWALAEVFWSPREAKNWKSFAQRMEDHFPRAAAAGVNVSHAVYDAVVTTSWKGKRLLCTMEAEIAGIEIYYTIDNTMPDNRSLRCRGESIVLPEEPVTLRVITYRNGAPLGHLITLTRAQLAERAGK